MLRDIPVRFNIYNPCLIKMNAFSFFSSLTVYRPPELVYKYGNLSEGACKPGYAAAKMSAIYPKYEPISLLT